MTSGPIVVYALEREDAVKKFRNLIGDTDPTKAEPGSIRSIYGTDIAHNAIHGSDSNENAATEILFFFPELQTKVLENKK
jgi:nucleoside-diphosphate kinase